MKRLLFLLIVTVTATHGQTRDEIVAGRAREFYKVMCQKERDVWQKFVVENYTKALQERQMQQKIASSDGTTTSSQEKMAALEGKVKMLERLNQDFGNGKLVSVKVMSDDVEMVATTADGMIGKFKFKFEKSAPYLIDGIGIQVGD